MPSSVLSDVLTRTFHSHYITSALFSLRSSKSRIIRSCDLVQPRTAPYSNLSDHSSWIFDDVQFFLPVSCLRRNLVTGNFVGSGGAGIDVWGCSPSPPFPSPSSFLFPSLLVPSHVLSRPSHSLCPFPFPSPSSPSLSPIQFPIPSPPCREAVPLNPARAGSSVSLYYLNCTKFGQLILGKIIKIIAIKKMSDFKAKMHQIRFRLGSAPSPAGELTALPRHPSLI